MNTERIPIFVNRKDETEICLVKLNGRKEYSIGSKVMNKDEHKM